MQLLRTVKYYSQICVILKFYFVEYRAGGILPKTFPFRKRERNALFSIKIKFRKLVFAVCLVYIYIGIRVCYSFCCFQEKLQKLIHAKVIYVMQFNVLFESTISNNFLYCALASSADLGLKRFVLTNFWRRTEKLLVHSSLFS